MSRIVFSLTALLILATAISGQSPPLPPPSSSTTPTPTPKPTTSATTPIPTTNHTTPTPITSPTTPTPPTSPITTPTTPSTPSTTATPLTTVPTPTAPTTKAPPHKDDTWVVKNETTGRVCVVAHMSLQMDIPYNTTNKTVVTAHVTVPGNATSSGSCSTRDKGVQVQQLVLNWMNNTVTLNFGTNATSKQFYLKSISAKIDVNNMTFPNALPGGPKSVLLSNDTQHFVTPVDNSYSCQSKVNLPALRTPPLVNHTAHFTLTNFQLEAYMNSTTNGFSSPIYCEGGNTPDLVPILVGFTLVMLVVVVLGVYLWGRKRSQARGYLSM